MNIPKISEAEWEVMNPLWETPGLTALNITEKLNNGWSPKTVKTLLSRLVKKGVITYTEKNHTYYYEPLYSKKDCTLQESEHLISRVFDGSLQALVANFIDSNKLSKEDIQELRKIIDNAPTEKND